MDYELRVIPECPNSASALNLFRHALAAVNAQGGVRVVQLDNEEQAEALHFHGSPSFIADGHDLFPSTASPSLTCRVYLSGDVLTGLPTQQDLRAALRSRASDRT